MLTVIYEITIVTLHPRVLETCGNTQNVLIPKL